MNKLKNIKSKQKFAIHLDIKNLRTKTGLNQVEFAKKAGVGLRFLRELEQGKISLP
jgi:DNA-binding transcriptional regulator YiaG